MQPNEIKLVGRVVLIPQVELTAADNLPNLFMVMIERMARNLSETAAKSEQPLDMTTVAYHSRKTEEGLKVGWTVAFAGEVERWAYENYACRYQPPAGTIPSNMPVIPWAEALRASRNDIRAVSARMLLG